MQATLKYLADIPLYEREKPYTLHGFPDNIKPKSNCEFILRDKIPIEDVRDSKEDFTLDAQGFEFHDFPSLAKLSAQTFEDPEGRQTRILGYLDETMKYTENFLGANKVMCFDWRFRKSSGSAVADDQLNDLENARYKAIGPASLMHCDYSYDGGFEIIKEHLTKREQDEILSGKVRAKIVNAWRPLQTVTHTPLIFCDRRTVSPDNIPEVDQVAPNRVELSATLQYNENQKYYWLSNQQPDEVSFFTCWDSRPGNNIHADHPPHGAFMTMNEDGLRESVEVRMLVLFDATEADV